MCWGYGINVVITSPLMFGDGVIERPLMFVVGVIASPPKAGEAIQTEFFL